MTIIKKNYTLYLLLDVMERLKGEGINRSELVNSFLLNMDSEAKEAIEHRIKSLELELETVKKTKVKEIGKAPIQLEI